MSIEERGDEVNKRTAFGHWEIDTVVGKKESSVLLSLDKRLTRKRRLVKITSRSSDAVRVGLEKIAELYGESFETVFKSVTGDNNGSEFVDLGRYLPKSTKVYYAHPYSSYERGTNEKKNSLVRRFFTKGKSLDNITDEQFSTQDLQLPLL